MTISVRLFARVRELIGADEIKLGLPSGSTVAELRVILTDQYPAAAGLIARSALAVNGEYTAEELLLGPADEVALIPPVSGGCGGTP